MYLTSNKTIRQITAIFETFNLLFIKLALKTPSKTRLFPGKIFRDYMRLVEKDRWICKEIFGILAIPPGTRITLEHLADESINTPIDELAYLALITAVTKPKHIFEIGTFHGRTALNFALNSPEDCVVYTLDLPLDGRANFLDQTNTADAKIITASFSRMNYKGKDVEHKIVQLFGNSLEFDFSPYFDKMDIVFVDGAHHYRAVKSDTDNALKMVNSGGVIIWDDFANYGDYNDVTRVILDSLPHDQVIQIANTQLAIYRPPERSD